MKVALLDAVGIYLGQKEIEAGEFDPEIHIDAAEYGGDCDLPVGTGLPLYRWNRELKRFEPVHAHQEQFASDMRKIIEFAAAQAVRTADPEIEPLIKKYFPAEHNKAQP